MPEAVSFLRGPLLVEILFLLFEGWKGWQIETFNSSFHFQGTASYTFSGMYPLHTSWLDDDGSIRDAGRIWREGEIPT